MTEKKIEIKRGLRDVYIDKTESSFIDGENAKLLYRGYDIHDLALKSTFEETSFLLLYGCLPTEDQLEEFDHTLKVNRHLPDEILEIIKLVANAHPMDVLRTGISSLAAYDAGVKDNSPEATLKKGIRLTAQAPTIVAAHARIRDGKQPIPPNSDLGHAANFLYMLFGEEPDVEDAKLLDRDFVLHAEHGVNASAFAARVVASTQADLHSALTTGVAALKGPSHGGAAEEVMKMALEIGSEENAESYVRNLISKGGRVMGFGHRVYRAGDPRAVHLLEGARDLSLRKGEPKWFEILQGVIRAMAPYSKKGICQNVDFFTGAIYYLLGIPDSLFISIFAMGRVPGWTLQVMEQFDNNILLRPRLEYVGPKDLEYIPVDRRS